MCAHKRTPLGVHMLYTAPSLAVVPAAAQLWWRKLDLNVPLAPHKNFTRCAKTHFATAEMLPELAVLKSLSALGVSQSDYSAPCKS